MSNSELMPLEEVHVLLLYLLKQINFITEKENIPYFSHGGTTLGAVRHKGFIPWDDDIDLMMERKYYDQFVAACNRLLPKEVVIRTRENDPYFCEEYIKICYRDEKCKYSDLSIDIFILDETNPDRKLFRAIMNKVIRWIRPVKLYKVSRKADYIETYVPHSKLKHIVLAVLSIIPLNWLTNLQTKAMLAEKKTTDWYVDWGSISPYYRATWPKDYYSRRIKLPFENLYVYASDKYLQILERGYGKNYMELPPVEKRKSHSVHRINNQSLDFEIIKKSVQE